MTAGEVQERHSPDDTQRERLVSRQASVMVAVACLLLGLGVGYLLFAPQPEPGGDADVEQLLDDYWAAFNARDAAAIRALMGEEGEWFGTDVAEPGDLEGRMAKLDNGLVASQVGDPLVVTGDAWGARWHEVAQVSRYPDGSEPEGSVYVFHLADRDGVLTITSVDALGGPY